MEKNAHLYELFLLLHPLEVIKLLGQNSPPQNSVSDSPSRSRVFLFLVSLTPRPQSASPRAGPPAQAEGEVGVAEAANALLPVSE